MQIAHSNFFKNMILHCVFKKDTDVGDYDFNAHQPILIIFDRDAAKKACYQMVLCYPTSHKSLRTTWGRLYFPIP